MDTIPDSAEYLDFVDLTQPRLTYGQLTRLTEVKNRTLRTWLNRYFPGVGTRKNDGKLLFSGLECLSLQVFARLVTRLTLKTETALIVARAGYLHLKNTLESEDLELSADIFLVIHNASKDDFAFEFVSERDAQQLFSRIDPAPFIVVPFSLKTMSAYDCLREIR